MKKRLLSALALLFCAAVTLSACEPGGTPSQAPASEGAAAGQSTEAAQTEAGDASAGDEAPLEISFVSPNWEDAPDFNNEWYTRFFEETNTKWSINFIPANDYQNKYDLILSSGDLPDVIMSEDANRPSTIQAIQNGAFWDLTPLLGDFSSYPNLRDNPTPNAFKYASYQGNIWGIPRSRPQVDLGISIRKDWLEKLGLPEPTTVEEYKDTLGAIVNGDPDGNGQNDTIGLVGWFYNVTEASTVLQNAFGVNHTEPDENGGLVHPRLKDEMADFVSYLNEMYDLGILSKEFSVMKNTQGEDIIISGRAASYGYNIWRDYDYSEKTKVTQPEAEFETLLPMTGPKGTTAFLTKGNYGFFHMNKKLPEEKVLRLLDYFEYTCTEDMTLKGYYGWEGVHFNYDENGTRVMTEVGKREIGTGIQQPLPMVANTWAKVVCVTAPKDYNDAKLERVGVIQEMGNIDRFTCFSSPAWTEAWPQVQSEYEANYVKAVAGQMTIDDFRAYLAELRERPEFKQAFQEFAQANKDIFGD